MEPRELLKLADTDNPLREPFWWRPVSRQPSLRLHQHGRLSATCHVCSVLQPSRPAPVSREQSQGERQQPRGQMNDTRPHHTIG